MLAAVINSLISIIIAAAATTFFFTARLQAVAGEARMHEGAIYKEGVRQSVERIKSRIGMQLEALAGRIADNNDFIMKMVVEGNPNDPMITELARQYMAPMQFSILDITDENGIIISSGHFPASVGNSMGEKFTVLESTPVLILDRILGENRVTIQARHSFRVGSRTCHCIGGLVVDEQFLKNLCPEESVTTVFQFGEEYLSTTPVSSLSSYQDNRLIFNGEPFLADTLLFPVSHSESPGIFYVIFAKPEKHSALKLVFGAGA